MAFAPTDIGSLALWVKADAGVYKTSAMTTIAGITGHPVGGWEDQSGNDRHLLQATAARRPTFRRNALGGLPEILFDGADDYLQALFTLAAPLHIFAILRQKSWTSGDVLIAGGVADNLSLFQQTATPRLGTWLGAGNSGNTISLALDTFGVVGVKAAAGVNGSLTLDCGSPVGQGGEQDPKGGITLGAHPNPSNYAHAGIVEVCVFSAVLTSEQEASMCSYLFDRMATALDECTRMGLYGDYEFPNTFWLAEQGRAWRVPASGLPMAHGAHSQTGYREGKRIVYRGQLIADSANVLNDGGTTSLRDKVDELAAALAAQPQDLYVDYDRYYRNVRVLSAPEPYYSNGQCRFTESFDIEFLASDPYQYGIDENSSEWDTPADAETTTVTPEGNAPAVPQIRVTLGGSGVTTFDITLTNETTGQSFRLTTTGASTAVSGGDVIVADCLEQTVTLSGDDAMDLFSGSWLTLAALTNTLRIDIDSGTIASVEILWRNRWN